MTMQITELTVHPTNDGLVRAYVDIVFDNCFMVRDIRVIKGPTGLSFHFLPRSRETAPIGILLFPPMLKPET